MKLFLDIETKPDPNPEAKTRISAQLKPPANLKKPESIAKWWDESSLLEIDRLWRRTALDGSYGELLCIGWAWLDPALDSFNDHVVRVLSRNGFSENMLLECFYDALNVALKYHKRSEYNVTVIGHNIGFDLRFLYQRTVVNAITPSVRLPTDHFWNSERSYCTMEGWTGSKGYVSLRELANILKIPHHKDAITGSDVWDMWLQNPASVESYCQQDVALTRAIYYRQMMKPYPTCSISESTQD